MYDLIRVLHSVNRWVVIVVLVVALARGIAGWRAKAAWTDGDRRLGKLVSGVADLQMALGLLLYVWLSPYTRAAFRDVGTAMSDDTLRFWLLEHGPVLLIAVVLIRIGTTRSERVAEGAGEAETWTAHRVAVTWYALATVLILGAIPWPFLPYGRPLLPGL